MLKTERNMRFHFLAAFFFILLGVYLDFTATEILILTTTIAMVLAAEMVNTTFEHIVDIIKSELSPIARIIKDIAAGAVLLTAINAIIVEIGRASCRERV